MFRSKENYGFLRRNHTVTNASRFPKLDSMEITSIDGCEESHSLAANCAASRRFLSKPAVCSPTAEPSKRTHSTGGGGSGGGVLILPGTLGAGFVKSSCDSWGNRQGVRVAWLGLLPRQRRAHPPLPAGAGIASRVRVEITGDHENRAAGRGWMMRLVGFLDYHEWPAPLMTTLPSESKPMQ